MRDLRAELMAEESDEASRSGLGWRRQTWEVAALVAVLGILAFVAWHRWTPPGYVGTSRRITLTWACTNGIQWFPPGQEATNGYSWWAGDDPVPSGQVVTAADVGRDSDGFSIERATGVLRFTSRGRATFRSDAGGTLAFTRWDPSPGRFRTAECRFGGPLGGGR